MKDNDNLIINSEETLDVVYSFINLLQTKNIVYIKDGANSNMYGGYYTYTDIYNNFNDSFICRIEVDYTKDNKFINAQILIKDFIKEN